MNLTGIRSIFRKKTSQKKEQNKKSKQIEIIDQKIKDTEGLRQQAV